MGKQVLAEDSAKLAGLQIDLLQKMRNGNISIDHLDYFLNLNFSQREELLSRKPKKEVYLKLISGGQSLFLDECDGQQTIADSKNVFYSIDWDFKNHGANKKGAKTPKTPIEIHEQIKNGKFTQIFGSINSDLNKLCLTQSQILNFIQKHKNWLNTNGNVKGTFFLCKRSNGKFFVACVNVDSDGLDTRVYRFYCSLTCFAEYRGWFVFPQQIS